MAQLLLIILTFTLYLSYLLWLDETDHAAVCEVEVKSLPPSSPSSVSLIAPQAEPVPAAAPTCLKDPQPAPTMPNKMPIEGRKCIVLHVFPHVMYPHLRYVSISAVSSR